MSEKIRSDLWVADVPDASINEVVMDINKRNDDEEVILIATVGIVERLVNSNKYQEAREGQSHRVIEKMPPPFRRCCKCFSLREAIHLYAEWKREILE